MSKKALFVVVLVFAIGVGAGFLIGSRHTPSPVEPAVPATIPVAQVPNVPQAEAQKAELPAPKPARASLDAVLGLMPESAAFALAFPHSSESGTEGCGDGRSSFA